MSSAILFIKVHAGVLKNIKLKIYNYKKNEQEKTIDLRKSGIKKFFEFMVVFQHLTKLFIKKLFTSIRPPSVCAH